MPEARDHLSTRGFVYTLRPKLRKTGKDTAYTGSYYKKDKIADVQVDFVKEVTTPYDLKEYVSGSGFKTVEDWWEAAEGSKFLFKVRVQGSPQYSTTVNPRKYWVIIDKPGDSYFTEGSAIPYEEFEKERKKILDREGKPPTIRIRLEEPSGNGGKEYQPSVIDLDALAATDPIRKFCCRQCGECAPEELLEEGKFLERISWLRHHYAEKHPGLWGRVGRMPETKPSGTCYEDAWRFLIKEEKGELVHGSVQTIGKRIDHAWVETETDYIWEPEWGEFMKKDYFYERAQPKVDARYTAEEAAIMAARTKTYGPWTDEERRQYLKEKSPAVEYLPDSAEVVAQTIAAAGYREKLDDAFQEAIARVRRQSGAS